MLTVEHLTVRYGDFTAVSDVSFRLEAGQWLMLCGPNGAGKSSLLGALSLRVPSSGRLLMLGQDLRTMKPAERARRIAVLAQRNSAAYAYTVEELVRLGRYAHRKGWLAAGADPEGEEKVEKALAAAGLTEYRRTSLLALSGGELQRAFLAQVLAQDPCLLLLDEPVNHLDLRYQRQLLDLVAAGAAEKPGRAVLAAVHDLSLALRYGTHALLLQSGRTAGCGTPAEVLTPERLHSVWGMDVAGWMRDLAEPWQRD